MKKQLILAFNVLIILFLLVQPAAIQAKSAEIESVARGIEDPVELETFLDEYISEQMEAHHIPGVTITFVKDGEAFFSKGYGYANVEKEIPFDPEQTLLTTASLGKAFTAVGVLQLNERGLIDLQEDVRPYFTEFELKTRFDDPLTFANLLTHTDGFEARMIGVAALEQDGMLPLGELIEAYTPVQRFPPGQYMTYGDFPANLAGYLTQEISDAVYRRG